MDLNLLGVPYPKIIVATKKKFGEFAYKLNYEKGYEFAVRVVRGDKMKSLDGLFNEFSAALQFPYYFGENWDALDECLSDLEWIPATSGYVLLIANTPEVLMEEDSSQFQTFIKILSRASRERDGANNSNRFFVFLHCQDDQLEELRERFHSVNVNPPQADSLA